MNALASALQNSAADDEENEVGHYLFPVHSSQEFLFTPTLSSLLYLLLCRFLTWSFPSVCQMVPSLSELKNVREKRLFAKIFFEHFLNE